MKHCRLAIIGLLVCLWFSAAVAQDQGTTLRLESDTLQLQTGQEYTVYIRLSNVREVWAADIEIQYDPALVYVFGTVAGTPVQQADFFNPSSSAVVRNAVQDNRILYTLSLLNPAPVASGSGTLGSFRIYPVAPGSTQLQFHQGELTTVAFLEEGGQRAPGEVHDVAFTPVLLELTISGDPVAAPIEATATPEPTATPEATLTPFIPGGDTGDEGLVNATPVPASTENTGAPSPALLIAVGAMILGLVGLVVLFVIYRRKR
jgi:hypothetical protein